MAEQAAARQQTAVRENVAQDRSGDSGNHERGEFSRTGLLVLADGSVFEGVGCGAEGVATGLLCFHTTMSAYQEVLTDPASAGHIVTFTFPHVGAAGTNHEDMESAIPHAVGCVMGTAATTPSNFRSQQRFDDWLAAAGRIGLAAVDTRAITRRIRAGGLVNAAIAHARDGRFDVEALRATAAAAAAPAPHAGCAEAEPWEQGGWRLGEGYPSVPPESGAPHVVVVDFGSRRTLLRQLVDAGLRVTVVAATVGFDEVERLRPDGLLLSSGPGNPEALAAAASPLIHRWLETGKPLFAVALGHQLLALALGAKVERMAHGRHGANLPVRHSGSGQLDIAAVNQDWTVRAETLPESARAAQISLFDQSLQGFELIGRPVFSIQHYPLTGGGGQHPFDRFVSSIKKAA